MDLRRLQAAGLSSQHPWRSRRRVCSPREEALHDVARRAGRRAPKGSACVIQSVRSPSIRGQVFVAAHLLELVDGIGRQLSIAARVRARCSAPSTSLACEPALLPATGAMPCEAWQRWLARPLAVADHRIGGQIERDHGYQHQDFSSAVPVPATPG